MVINLTTLPLPYTPPPPKKKEKKKHEIDATKMCSAQNLKSNVDNCVVTKIPKRNFKRLYKIFPTYFSRIFTQNFSNRPYPNVKAILAYFYVVKTI